MEPAIARAITAERLRRVIQGYSYRDQKGNEKAEAGQGGGFRYCELGPTLFDAGGQIRAVVTFTELAQHVFFIETGQPLPPQVGPLSPWLGVVNGAAVYLLYNGILHDRSEAGGNVLTRAVLQILPPHAGPKVIYGTGCMLGEALCRRLEITFRQIPYEVRGS